MDSAVSRTEYGGVVSVFHFLKNICDFALLILKLKGSYHCWTNMYIFPGGASANGVVNFDPFFVSV